MAKKKVYAVREGRTIGLFYSWDECKAQVDGYSGAQYKSFPTEEEARAYLYGEPVGDPVTETAPAPVAIHADNGEKALPLPYAFVDGSYNPKTAVSGYGGFLVMPDGTEHVLQGTEERPEWTAMRNVAGEVAGCMAAVQKALELGLTSLHIYYDYMGIEQWAIGGWEARKPETKHYAAFMENAMQRIGIAFHKVAGHTGIPGNERADVLAKQAVGVK